ncbi:MAG: exo-alpha-sialidase, partial [Planctomycetaceae bacterium]|nr:exo-alpha-sialidase [Planctomycetaceae bacterium]
MKSYLNRSPLNQAGFILLLLAAVTTANQRHCQAESRLLVKATSELPRHGEGSLLTLDNGRLLLVYTQWYGATGNDHDPARLVQIHSDDGGKTWSTPQTVQENIGKMNVMSASLVKTTSGKILLIYIRIDSNRFANLWFKESTDQGVSWSEPKQLSHGKQGLIFAVNSAAIRLKSGRILLAAYGSPSAWQKDEHFVSFSYYSDDEGQTWHRSGNQVDCPLRGAMEPEIEQLSDGRILMLIRTQTTRM